MLPAPSCSRSTATTSRGVPSACDVLDDGEFELRTRPRHAVGDRLGLVAIHEAFGQRVIECIPTDPTAIAAPARPSGRASAATAASPSPVHPTAANRVRHSPEVQSRKPALLRGPVEPGLRTGVGVLHELQDPGPSPLEGDQTTRHFRRAALARTAAYGEQGSGVAVSDRGDDRGLARVLI